MPNSLKYNDLWDVWMQAREQPTPKGFEPIKPDKSGPTPYFLKPEDMVRVLMAISPYDLYTNKRVEVPLLGYPTSAFNISNRSGYGVPNAMLFSSQAPQNKWLPIKTMEEEAESYGDIPRMLRKLIPQGIYEHELAHFNDPRLRPEANNYGYMMYGGLPGNIFSREYPAIRAEDKFWDKLRR